LEKAQRRNSNQYGETLSQLADIHAARGDLKESRSLLTQALATLERAPNRDDRTIAAVINKLEAYQ
jgi:hypothetical protein